MSQIEELKKELETIGPPNLTKRLAVPASDDPLNGLAQSLNAMLSRIELGYRSIERFTADASHELRAPLSLIITATEVSLRNERSNEELKDTLRKIIREARYMSRLVEGLLAVARGNVQQGAEMLHVDVVGLLRELCDELEPSATEKGLKLISALPGRPVEVVGDRTELRRLFLILLDNAVKYTEAGSIALTLAAEARLIRVTVADTGVGIERDALSHVFDRFWRADKGHTRAESGVGLGLSLASEIVRKHGGTISVESEVGVGTSFVVQLRSVGLI